MGSSRTAAEPLRIPRNALALILVTVFAVVAPHVPHLSLGTVSAALLCVYWRAQVHRGRWAHPPWWIKAVLVLVGIAIVVGSAGRSFTLETATNLLIVAYALKLIELRSRRDAYIVLFLSYFVLATEFLFSQSLLLSAYQFGVFVLVTAAMTALNHPSDRVRPVASIRTAATLVVQAVPLTIVLFVFFPRVAPLWDVPIQASVTTGLSSRMAPGDIAELSQSDEIAFRVRFDGRVPTNRELYWRGITYETYDGGAWKVNELLEERRRSTPYPDFVPDTSYEILFEPTQRKWLYALATADSTDPGVKRSVDMNLRASWPVTSLLRYTAVSDRDYQPGGTLKAADARRLVQVPAADNPQLRQFARSLRDEAGSDEAFVESVLQYVRDKPFHYTLRPGTLREPNRIDRFWFDTRRGFCSHYAGALVFMLRSIGVPSRVVAGYQGGAINPISNLLVVRQYDAHAWVEFWLPNSGWQRVDPTAAVAPQRIEQGLDAALSASDRRRVGGFAGARWDTPLAARVLDWFDAMETRWNLWVVGFDGRVQSGVLQRWLGSVSPTRVGVAMLVIGALCLSLVAAYLFWQRRRSGPQNALERMLKRAFRTFASLGHPRAERETPGRFMERIATSRGTMDASVASLIADVQRFLYNPPEKLSRRELALLRARLVRFQLRMAFAPKASQG